MPTPEIEEFAKRLVQYVRDAAIRSSDMDLSPNARSPIGKRWKQAMERGPEAFADTLIPDIVDDTIFYLLHAIDDGGLKLTYTADNG